MYYIISIYGHSVEKNERTPSPSQDDGVFRPWVSYHTCTTAILILIRLSSIELQPKKDVVVVVVVVVVFAKLSLNFN